MATGLAYSPRFLEHVPGPTHPESPARLRAIYGGLEAAGLLGKFKAIDFVKAPVSELGRVHTASYIERVRHCCQSGAAWIDSPDSEICPDSYEVARLAVGAVLAGCDEVMAGVVTNALCLVRPPGHHAEADRSMGFCLFNNVAIAARRLQQVHGLQRILILDWDVHHGNGTQHVFESDPGVLYISLHQSPDTCYPGTGFAREQGTGMGKGATVNIPFEPGASDDDYRTIFMERLRPIIDRFSPEFVLVSSGFDSHTDDPLAGVCLSIEGLDFLLRQTCDAARRLCGGRLVVTLEGGYNLDVLAEGVSSQARILVAAGKS